MCTYRNVTKLNKILIEKEEGVNEGAGKLDLQAGKTSVKRKVVNNHPLDMLSIRSNFFKSTAEQLQVIGSLYSSKSQQPVVRSVVGYIEKKPQQYPHHEWLKVKKLDSQY